MGYAARAAKKESMSLAEEAEEGVYEERGEESTVTSGSPPSPWSGGHSNSLRTEEEAEEVDAAALRAWKVAWRFR